MLVMDKYSSLLFTFIICGHKKFYKISPCLILLIRSPVDGTAHFKNVNNCFNNDISFYLETCGGQNSNLYLILFHFSTPVLIRHLWQLKTVVFLYRCQMHGVLLKCFCANKSVLNWTWNISPKLNYTNLSHLK